MTLGNMRELGVVQDQQVFAGGPRQLENRRLVFRAVIRTNVSFDNFG
jgi:hypothetical protein